MKRFASIAAATAIAATCLIAPAASADTDQDNAEKCASLKAQAAAKGYDKLSAHEYGKAVRKDLIKKMGKQDYQDLTDSEKKGLRTAVAHFVNRGYECGMFETPSKSGSASGSSSGLFGSS